MAHEREKINAANRAAAFHMKHNVLVKWRGAKGEQQVTLDYRGSELVEDFLCRVVKATRVDLVWGYFQIGTAKWAPMLRAEPGVALMEMKSYPFDTLVYVARMGGAPRACHWRDYIACASVRALDRRVEWHPTLTVCFKPFRPYTPRYRIDCALLTQNLPERHDFQNMWGTYWDTAGGYAYRFTSDPVHRPYVMLLELRPDLDPERLAAVQYDVFGCNKTYYGGEYDSWQRYTRSLPIPYHVTTATDYVAIRPVRPLRPNCWHVLALLNTGITSHEGLPSLYNDHLIPFLTNDASVCTRACLTFLMHMKRMGMYPYLCARLVCRYHVWPSRFDQELWSRRHF